MSQKSDQGVAASPPGCQPMASISQPIEFRQPLGNERRDRTLTIWASERQVREIDATARQRGLSRAYYLAKCINAGSRALRGGPKLTPNELVSAVAAWFEYIDGDEEAYPGDAHLEGQLLEAMRAALAKAQVQV